MIQTLRYQDEKSDKFWRLETSGRALVINWGKTGANGRYEIKQFVSEEECEKNAAKLAAAKQKKGYVETPNFDVIKHDYFDTDEYGLHPLTSHPLFRQYFSDELYYDCANDDAPFGNDNGSDALYCLQELLRKRPNMPVLDFPKLLIEKDWGLPYLPPKPNQTDKKLKEQAAQQVSGLPDGDCLFMNDQVILATALGQIKITGHSDAALTKLAFLSLSRMERLYRLLWKWEKKEAPPHIALMQRDLTAFVKETHAFS